MMVHDQFKNQDTKFFTQHKSDYVRIPEPKSLPNGQKPDFGNSFKSSKKQNHNNSHQPQQRLPNGKVPDFGNATKKQSQNVNKKKQSHNNNNNNNTNTNTRQQNSASKSKNNNKNNNNSNQKKSPLSSPKVKDTQINNYELTTPRTAPLSSGSSASYSKNSAGAASFAGSTFSNSPKTSNIPKPSFL